MKKRLGAVVALGMALTVAACGKDTGAAVEQAATDAVETTADAATAAVEQAAADAAEQAQQAAEDAVEQAQQAATDAVVDAAADAAAALPEGVMTYAEYAAAEIDTPVTIVTYVQAKQSWWDDKATVYTQDADGAYFLYNMACKEDEYQLLTPGTKILVDGYKSEWSGEVEIVDATFTLVDGDSYVASPVDVTELLGTDELIGRQNQLVSFTGMTVEPKVDADGNEVAFLYSWDGSGSQEANSDLYFDVSVNGQTYSFTVESYLCDNTTDVYKAVEGLQVGDTVDMEGFLYWYEGVNPHITSVTVK